MATADVTHPCGCRTRGDETMDYCGGPPGHRDRTPKRLLVCFNCGKEGVRSRRPGAVCTLCQAENWEPFREGWD
jgi:trans-2-enoyl-CoA reductase